MALAPVQALAGTRTNRAGRFKVPHRWYRGGYNRGSGSAVMGSEVEVQVPMAQIDPAPAFNMLMVDRVVEYLQTNNPRLFPFAMHFNAQQRRAFKRDLREGLGDLVDSGSARKTSATGKIMNDRRLREVIDEWARANGGWPIGADPTTPVTALGSSSRDDTPDGALLPGPADEDTIAQTPASG